MNSEIVRVTKIVYTPHCGNCGYPIPVSIEYQNLYVENKEKHIMRKIGADIYPCNCPHCGVLFDSIEITLPKKREDIYFEE